MALFAIVMALLLEQVRPPGPGNLAAQAVRRWVRGAGRAVDAGGATHGWLAWALAVPLPALAAAALHWLLLWLGGWPLALLWSVGVLYLTLGFRQFSHHFTGIRAALEEGDAALARQRLARWQQVDAAALPHSEIVRHVIEYSVLAAHRHVFGVLAWFCLLAVLGLGPAGAVFYRCADFAAAYWQRKAEAADLPASPALCGAAHAAWRLIDWLPARMTALGFAIVGRFEDAIDLWRQQAPRLADGSDGVILAATAGALGVRLGGSPLQRQHPATAAPPATQTARPAQPHPPGQPTAPASPPPSAALPGEAPTCAHFDQVVALLWRTVALWLLLLVLATLSHLLG